jgi:hypothetical protein
VHIPPAALLDLANRSRRAVLPDDQAQQPGPLGELRIQ